MKKLMVYGVFAAMASFSNAADKKPAISEENLSELQTVRRVFVDGNSESAGQIRGKIEKFTCLKLTNNKLKADAIITSDEQARRSHSVFVGNQNKVSASVVVTMPNGDQVWDLNKLHQDGFVHSGAGSAITDILRLLAKDACPGWKQP
jgi:hypothetical protein